MCSKDMENTQYYTQEHLILNKFRKHFSENILERHDHYLIKGKHILIVHLF